MRRNPLGIGYCVPGDDLLLYTGNLEVGSRGRYKRGIGRDAAERTARRSLSPDPIVTIYND